VYIYDRQLTGSQHRRKEQPITLRPSQPYYYPNSTQIGSGIWGQGLGQVVAPIDVDRAVRLNRHYAQLLGWQAQRDRILHFLGLTPMTGPRAFAEAVAQWQRSQLGLAVDGVIGPDTWRHLQSAMGLQPAQVPTQPWEPMPQPEPKAYRLAPPRSVAEAIELLEYARDLARGHPPDLVGAQAAVSAADAWLYPLRDNIHRRFQPGGFFRLRRFIGLPEVQTAALLAGRGIEEVRSLKRKLALGSSVAWDSSINAVRFARYFLEVLADEGVSFELKDALAYRPSLETAGSKKLGLSKSQVRVLAWLRKHKRTIVQAERLFRIDRRAVAGAIAWEALENPLFIPVRGIGPGKMHYKTGAFGGEDTVAKQVEDAGYLPTKRSQEERKKSLSTPSGAIMYIAASMKAAADIAWQEHGSDIYRDLGVLTWFYQSTDLKEWRQHLKNKKAKGERTFDVQKEPMPRWVLNHLAFLEFAVGKPNFVPKYP
jgi:hypothetical protein